MAAPGVYLDTAELAVDIGLDPEVDGAPAALALFLGLGLVPVEVDLAQIIGAAMRACHHLLNNHTVMLPLFLVRQCLQTTMQGVCRKFASDKYVDRWARSIGETGQFLKARCAQAGERLKAAQVLGGNRFVISHYGTFF